MRILFLSPRQPLPARSGAKLREYHFLRALGRSAEITYLYFIDPGAQGLTPADLRFCREVVGIPKPPAYGLIKTFRGIAGRWPLPILNYTSAEMSAEVRRLVNTREFDIVHLRQYSHDPLRDAATERKSSLKAVYNWHNIESEAMRRYSDTAPSGARGAGTPAYTASRLERLEKDILHSAFGHIVCSDARARAAPAHRAGSAGCGGGKRGGYRLLRQLRRGSDPQAAVVVFVGAMDYFPNREAAVFFAERIWPHVRKRLSGAELAIVGANPGAAVLALGELPGVKVTGTVPDVRPVLPGGACRGSAPAHRGRHTPEDSGGYGGRCSRGVRRRWGPKAWRTLRTEKTP